MSRQRFFPCAVLFAVVVTNGLTGCGSGDQNPISSKTSAFKVAGGDKDGSSGSGDTKSSGASAPSKEKKSASQRTQVSGAPKAVANVGGQQPQKKSLPVVSGGGGGKTEGNGQGKTVQTNTKTTSSKTAGKKGVALSKPPSRSGDELDNYTVPKTLADLTEFMHQMDKNLQLLRVKAGRLTPAAFYKRVERIFRAKLEAANRILAIKPIPEKDRIAALRTKLEALAAISEVTRKPKDAKALLDYAAIAAKDADKSVASMATVLVFRDEVKQFVLADKREDFPKLLKKLDSILAYKEAGIKEFANLRDIGFMIVRVGLHKQGFDFLKKVGTRFREHPTSLVSKGARELSTQLFYLDFQNKMVLALQGKPKSIEIFMQAVVTALNEVPESFMQMMIDVKSAAEYRGNIRVAAAAYGVMGKWISKQKNPPKQLQKTLHLSTLRIALIGKPVKLDGILPDASAFDWNKYRGKIVLVDFWATWCGPCIREIPNMKANLAKFQKLGFEIVGINLDQRKSDVDAFLSKRTIPWATVVSKNPELPNPVVNRCGVEGIPFMFLVDREGKVMAIHTRGPRLERLLIKVFRNEVKFGKLKLSKAEYARLLGPTKAETEAAKKGGKNSAGAKKSPKGSVKSPKGIKKAKAGSKKTKPAARKQSSIAPSDSFYFVSFEDEKKKADKDKKGETSKKAEAKDNPYLAQADLSTRQLIEFILDMKDKPKSIQQRDGFVEAVTDAANRVLKDKKASGRFQDIAVTTNLSMLHKKACLGDETCEKQLRALVKRFASSKRKKIASFVAFLRIEGKTMNGEKLKIEDIDKLLAEVKGFATKNPLDERHLRLASKTVGIINRIPDGDKREKHFSQFGKLFAKSSYKRLARYGKSLASAKGGSNAVGKTIEIAGTTALGDDFNVTAYRGKYVIVDFWATWCGPCVREIPNLKRIYAKMKARGVEVVAVNLDRDPKKLAKFLDEKKINWVNVIGADAKAIARKYEVTAIPTVMLVDPNGKVLHAGHRLADLEKKLVKLLAKK